MVSEENGEDYELESMVASNQQVDHTKMQKLSSSMYTKIRNNTVWILLSLIFIISCSVGVIVYHQSLFQNGVNTKEQGLDSYESNHDSDESIPKLRSYVEEKTSKSSGEIGHMNIYVSKYRSGSRKGGYKRFPAPVVRYARRQNPLKGPLLSFIPHIQIFADRLTKQTVIYSLSGVYILPPVVTFVGQLFSIAELIASGYASLVSSGIPPTGTIDMTHFHVSTPLTGPGIPILNPLIGRFSNGIRTKFRSFSTAKRYKIRPITDLSSEANDHYKENDKTKYQYKTNRPKSNRNKPLKISKPRSSIAAHPSVLYVWSGQDTSVSNAADFVAVVDFSEKSSTYGEILRTIPLVSDISTNLGQSKNEPHHSSISSD